MLIIMNKRQQLTLKRHSKHHSKKHMKLMETEMKKGRSFTKAHKLALKRVGK